MVVNMWAGYPGISFLDRNDNYRLIIINLHGLAIVSKTNMSIAYQTIVANHRVPTGLSHPLTSNVLCQFCVNKSVN